MNFVINESFSALAAGGETDFNRRYGGGGESKKGIGRTKRLTMMK